MTINQCDGCRRGVPIKHGTHWPPGNSWGAQSCTAYLYIDSITCPDCVDVKRVSTSDPTCDRCRGTKKIPKGL